MKSTSLTLTLAGPANAGKSTLLNLIAGQDAAITSPIPGTTTDTVEKMIELIPLGPVLLLDTPGWDDPTPLAAPRRTRTQNALERADIILGVIPACTDPLDPSLQALLQSPKPLILILTHPHAPNPGLTAALAARPHLILDPRTEDRDSFLNDLKALLAPLLPAEFTTPPDPLPPLPPQALILHIIPIDSQAPKGRLILPQVNLIRAALDANHISIVATEKDIPRTLASLSAPPRLVICDSQALHATLAALPPTVPCTTYSILLARLKGDLPTLARGAQAIATLKAGDRILIAEACTHHAGEEDIGRVKIPALIRRAADSRLEFDIASGRDFPPDLAPYALVIHCGGCMINRSLMLARTRHAAARAIPITNYGLAIAAAQGHLDRVLRPFGLSGIS